AASLVRCVYLAGGCSRRDKSVERQDTWTCPRSTDPHLTARIPSESNRDALTTLSAFLQSGIDIASIAQPRPIATAQAARAKVGAIAAHRGDRRAHSRGRTQGVSPTPGIRSPAGCRGTGDQTADQYRL